MADTLEPLIIDLLEWMAPSPRPYVEVMEAWRTSCPRLPVWEDAIDRGLIVRRCSGGSAAIVELTAAGTGLLETHRDRRLSTCQLPGP